MVRIDGQRAVVLCEEGSVGAVGTKTNGAVSRRQSAAEKARGARIKLHRDRDARDLRVEAAAAEVFTAQDELATADDALAAARAAAAATVAAAEAAHAAATRSGEAAVSAALRKLTAEKLNTAEIVELTSLPAADVRRLTKTVPAGTPPAGPPGGGAASSSPTPAQSTPKPAGASAPSPVAV